MLLFSNILLPVDRSEVLNIALEVFGNKESDKQIHSTALCFAASIRISVDACVQAELSFAPVAFIVIHLLYLAVIYVDFHLSPPPRSISQY